VRCGGLRHARLERKVGSMKFSIFAREVYITRYRIEANSPMEALNRWNEGEDSIDSVPEYSHIDGYTHMEDEEGRTVMIEGEEPE
jgi:hypothetical protein